MSFQFGFSGDDIEESEDVAVSSNPVSSAAVSLAPDYEPTPYTVQDLLPTEPMRISFEYIDIPTDSGVVRLAKRDLYDVRYQLMRQDHLDPTEEIFIRTNVDVQATTYEGGLKVWECSIDLVKYLDTTNLQIYKIIVELGCGAALPTAHLFAQALRSNVHGVSFVLADYNKSVLRLVTVINLLVTWAIVVKQIENTELDLTVELMQEFVADLQQRSIELKFVSGGWSADFVHLVGKAYADLVLASETIYSPETIPVFTNTLLGTLAPSGHGLVASKKIYFGIGGGVPEFIEELHHRNAHHELVYEDKSSVGRVILEVNK